MIRIGLGIIVLSVLFYMWVGQATEAPPGAGANIGAGVGGLAAALVFVIGLLVALAGLIRWVILRKNASKADGNSHPVS